MSVFFLHLIYESIELFCNIDFEKGHVFKLPCSFMLYMNRVSRFAPNQGGQIPYSLKLLSLSWHIVFNPLRPSSW